MKTNLLNLEPRAAVEAVRDFAVAHGEPVYRGGQVVRRLWHTPVATFEEMTDLSLELRAELAKHFAVYRTKVQTSQRLVSDMPAR